MLKGKIVDIADYVESDLFVVVAELDNGYVLEVLTESQIDANAEEGFDLFFNVLPKDNQGSAYDEIVLSMVNGGHDITYITTNNNTIAVFFNEIGGVYDVIDTVCAIRSEQQKG